MVVDSENLCAQGKWTLWLKKQAGLVSVSEIEVTPEDALVVVSPGGVPKDSHAPRLRVLGVLPQIWGLVLLRHQAVKQDGGLLIDALLFISFSLPPPHVVQHVWRRWPDLQLRDALEQFSI